jgi:hypothetical protein
MMKVEIDNIKYVPASEEIKKQVKIKEIRRKLVEIWWGEGKSDAEIEELSKELFIHISDDAEGELLENFLINLLN